MMGKTFSTLCLLVTLAAAGTCHALTPQEAEKFTHVAGFSMAGPKLFAELKNKLGKSQVRESGDGANGQSRVCYQTAHGEAVLEFFEGELETGFTARKPGARDAQCSRSNALAPNRLDVAGIRLGMSRASYEKLVGKPDRAAATNVEHAFHYEQGGWSVDILLNARFTEDHLTSITVTRAAQN